MSTLPRATLPDHDLRAEASKSWLEVFCEILLQSRFIGSHAFVYGYSRAQWHQHCVEWIERERDEHPA